MNSGAIFISFDAVAVSGITVESIKVAKKLDDNGIISYLDLGYDIKVDKGNFGKPYDKEKKVYQGVFNLVRIDDIKNIPDYNVGFLEYLNSVLISGSVALPENEKTLLLSRSRYMSQELSMLIFNLWCELNIKYVFVENATLPENIIYTEALYQAIEIYGEYKCLDNFVIWRDHDLMWNSEKSVMKYGVPPYKYAIKPRNSKYITYVTLNSDLKEKLEEWCNYDVKVKVVKNTYDFKGGDTYINIRDKLKIGHEDVLIARTTRIIPQKRLDRDIYLIQKLNQLFIDDNMDRKVFLVIAGEQHENDEYFQELNNKINELNLVSFIKFIGPLHHIYMPSQVDTITIEDLYHSCDLVSFLTSWDYDSYGNPVGEAISSNRCYITSNYEYYHEVFGKYDFEAPVMDISKEQDGLPYDNFITDVYKLINDRPRMNKIASRNFSIGKEVLSNDIVGILNLV